ncbi:MAG: CCA tRNA nucleotidyltransferase [Candidatus Hadarchaeum sp.]|uniref:CCA tRNA nucleotidyltransferase n=1 Tax=Candidatus Hadarchaeum sp. TaxID=2883567 RepID=UPI003D13F84E
MSEILATVLKRVKPTAADIRLVDEVASEVIRRTSEAISKLGFTAKPMLVGSVARGTWLRQDPDIDVFILFEETLTREELERRGLAVAREVAGPAGEEKFAEHPYVTMKFRGLDIDLVPCFDVTDPKMIKSAVDRSPHHQRYVKSRLTPQLADEVLLLKQFASGSGVYGAELKKQGFSGYLCELLILHYGSFSRLVEEASKWVPGEVVDILSYYPEKSEARLIFENQPLVVVDPVDPHRNAAAAVSLQNFSIFVRACQDFLDKPGLRFFFPRPVRLLTPAGLGRILRRRGTKLFCIVFRSPLVVPDVLYPQLRKTERAIVTRLVQEGFEVLRSDVWSNAKSVILVELSVSKLPGVKTRVGPPPNISAKDFVQEHLGSGKCLAGPMVDAAGRVVFEVKREWTDALALIKDTMAQRISFGKHVSESIAQGYRIIEGESLKRLLRERGFNEFLAEYLTRKLPWYR